MKKSRLLASLIVVTLFVQNVSALLTYLPSEPGDALYQGQSEYSVTTDTGGLTGRVEFAVYDYDHWTGPLDHEAPGQGSYVYAYQIFTDDISTDPLEYFAVFGIDLHEMDISGDDAIGTEHDFFYTPEGINADFSHVLDDHTKATWSFTGGLFAGERSWLLVFSSDSDWVIGTYEVRRPEFESVVPVGKDTVPIPEPITVGLLGIGSLAVLSARRKKVR